MRRHRGIASSGDRPFRPNTGILCQKEEERGRDPPTASSKRVPEAVRRGCGNARRGRRQSGLPAYVGKCNRCENEPRTVAGGGVWLCWSFLRAQSTSAEETL